MKKSSVIKILILLFCVVFVFLLAYNSFVGLSYSRNQLFNYYFLIPKNLKYEFTYTEGKIYSDEFYESSFSIYKYSFSSAKTVADSYLFYDGDMEVVSRSEKDGLYEVIKKVTYSDSSNTYYVATYVYDLGNNNMFVASFEYSDLKSSKYISKIIKNIVKTISLY